MKSLMRVYAAVVALVFAAGLGAPARAQGVVIGDQSSKPAWQLPSRYRKALEEDDMKRQRPKADLREVESKPLVDAAGDQFVGIVGKRTLTKPQLDKRVNLIVSRLPPAKDKNDEIDRRVGLEGRIVAEWEKAAALAMMAESKGFTATEQEVDQAIRDLSAKSEGNTNKDLQQVRMVGISDADLRQEVADGIIVEKMIRSQVTLVRDEDLQEVFKHDPDVFLEPTRVKAWHLVAPLLNSPTEDQLKALKKSMSKLAKRLGKCREEQDYKALQKELVDQKVGIMLAFLDDVASNEPLQPEVIKALFGLKPGKMSDLLTTPPPPKKPTELHVVKVLERKEGHRGTFDEAKPQVQNYMGEKMKDVIYETMLDDAKYDIRTDPAGLNEYREIRRIPAKPQVAAPQATPKPRASLRTPFTPGRPVRTNAFGQDPPPVESVVGSRAEPVAPGLAATSPARNLDPQTGRPLNSPADPPAADGAAGALAGAAPVPGSLPGVANETPAAADAGMGGSLAAGAASATSQATEGQASAEAAPAQAQEGTPLPASVRRTSSRRRRPAQTRNYNVNPPSVEEALSRSNR